MSCKANSGSFKPGFDPRRHVFSKAECRKGVLIATRLAKMPSRVRAWLGNKIRWHYPGARLRRHPDPRRLVALRPVRGRPTPAMPQPPTAARRRDGGDRDAGGRLL